MTDSKINEFVEKKKANYFSYLLKKFKFLFADNAKHVVSRLILIKLFFVS